MKGTRHVLRLAMGLACLGAGESAADEHGQPTLVRVPKQTGKVQADGRLSEEVWQKAAKCERFIRLDGKTPATQPTEVRVFCDEAGLWFSFHCRQPNPPIVNLWKHDQNVWEDDSVEIFLDPEGCGRRYYHFLVNAANVNREEMGMDPGWTGPWESATVPTPDGWSAEIYIPFATIGVDRPGSTPLGVNFCRNDIARKESSSWSGTPGSFHQPETFGLALLGQGAGQVTIQPPQVRPNDRGGGCSFDLSVRNGGHERLSAVLKLIPVHHQAPPVTRTVEMPAAGSWNGTLTTALDKPGRYPFLVLVEVSGTVVAATRTCAELGHRTSDRTSGPPRQDPMSCNPR